MNKHENDFNKLMFDKDVIVLKPLLDEDIPLFDRWLSKDYIYKWLCPDGEGQRDAWLDEVNNRNGKYDFITFGYSYRRKPNASISTRRLYNDRALLKLSFALGIFSHIQCDPVLCTAGRVKILQFCQDVRIKPQFLLNIFKL